MRAYRLHARGEAYAPGVRLQAAQIPYSVGLLNKEDMISSAQGVLQISQLVVLGRAAMLDNQSRVAARAFRRAIKIEESPLFADLSDPPAWWCPAGPSPSAALLAAPRCGAETDQCRASSSPARPVTTMLRARVESRWARRMQACATRRFTGAAGVATTMRSTRCSCSTPKGICLRIMQPTKR